MTVKMLKELKVFSFAWNQLRELMTREQKQTTTGTV